MLLRLMPIMLAAATVALIIAAVFAGGGGEVGTIDREGMKHFHAGRYALAMGVWEEGLARFPESPRLNYRVGTALAVRGNFPAAAKYLEEAAALSPEDPEICRELALCYLQDERAADAERELKRVLELADWFPEVHYFLGTIYERQGRHDEALGEYVKELNVNPGCTYAWAKIQTWEKAAAKE